VECEAAKYAFLLLPGRAGFYSIRYRINYLVVFGLVTRPDVVRRKIISAANLNIVTIGINSMVTFQLKDHSGKPVSRRGTLFTHNF